MANSMPPPAKRRVPRRGVPRVLFIARAYPPTVGGMEHFAYQLREHLDEFVDVVPLINRRGKKALPVFLPYAALAATRCARNGSVDAVHLADALLAPVGAFVKAATGVTVTASICGLDVTYPNRGYQAMVQPSLRRLDLVLPISRATEEQMRARAGDLPPSRVIPPGVAAPAAPDSSAIDAFERVAGPLEGRRVLITVGRLIERKGVAWFVEYVLPRLAEDVSYVVIGEGPQRTAIVRAAAAAGVSDRVHMTGRVNDQIVAAAYARADAFVMPNVSVRGDMEGFGLVALEAAAAEVPVVASALEGITDAVRDDLNGWLVPPHDAQAAARTIMRVLDLPLEQRRALGSRFARYTLREYGWRKVARSHADAISSLTAGTERELKAAA